jgi:hypothetical protein
MAASLFGGKKGDSVAALQPVPTVPKEVVVPQTDLFIVDEEPEDYTSRRRGTEELFNVIKDLLTRRFQDVERGFQELDESNTKRITQELMFQLLQRYVCLFVCFNTTFNNISVLSWWSVLLVEETGGSGENH